MRILKNKNIKEYGFTAVTLGNFDGIHLGHMKLISAVKKYSEEYSLKSVVFSFYPHPKVFFYTHDKQSETFMSEFEETEKRMASLPHYEEFYTIFSNYEKERIIAGMEVDELIEYPFTLDFANMEPEDFACFIFDKIMCKVLIVGEDYCFGKNRKGNFDLLKHIGDKKGAKVIKISAVKDNGIRVSSTRIRKSINEKNFDEASRLLGKPYFIMGNVVEGKKNGRILSFPTANIVAPKNKLLPSDGVYVTKTFYNGNLYESITNIGMNPTFGGKKKTVESFIFDFNEDLYGKEIVVCFYKFIRSEKKFNSLSELRNQIILDKKMATEFFFKHDNFKI